MRRALQRANLQPEDVGYINAHGTSTPIGDKKEIEAIRAVFGDKVPPISSTKSLTGHSLGAVGVQEAIYSLLMMQNGFIAPNINFENPDEHSAKINVIPQTLKQDFDLFLSNSFGFGGTNASLVMRRLDA